MTLRSSSSMVRIGIIDTMGNIVVPIIYEYVWFDVFNNPIVLMKNALFHF
jgi:hypothetical protein